jgi:hypothetical protein
MKNNLYKIFKLGQPRYLINKKELKTNYIKLLNIIHPNKWVFHSEKKYKLSEKITSELNEGYKILNNDIMRGQYILLLKSENKNILNENLKYIYSTDIEVNNILKELHFIDESIKLYIQCNNLFELRKLLIMCSYNIEVIEKKYDEILLKNDSMYIARFYLLILERCKNQIELINFNLIFN